MAPCEDATEDPIQVKKFEMHNLPVPIPGKVQMSLQFESSIEIKAPVTIDIELHKKIMNVEDPVYVECSEDFGSCSIDDACEYLFTDTECPEDSNLKDGLPCRCPVSEGMHEAANVEYTVKFPDASTLPGYLFIGKFNARVTLMSEESRLMCVNVDFEIGSSITMDGFE